MTRATCLLAGVCLLGFGGVAMADTAATTATAQADTSQTTALNAVVVTAQRRSERLQNVPVTVEALSPSQLQKSGVVNFQDLQEVVPGLTFAGQGSVAQPSIRGVSTYLSTAGSENPNALYIDGIYQSSEALLNLDLPDVSSIEVLKGPQGTLFGRNATGGAIQIYTRDPTFSSTVDLTAEGSEYTGNGGSNAAPRANLRGFVAGPIIPDVLAASLSASWDHTPGFETDDDNGARTGVITKQSYRAKLLFTPTDTLRIVVGGYDIWMNLQGIDLSPTLNGISAANLFPGSIISTQPWHGAFDPGYNTAMYTQYGGTLRAELELPFGKLTDLAGYNSSKETTFDLIAGANGAVSGCTQNFICIDYNFVPADANESEELNFASHSIGVFSFVAGLYYFHGSGATHSLINANFVPGGFPGPSNTYNHTSYAAYGEATFKPIDPLSIVFGLRYSVDQLHDALLGPPLVPETAHFSAVTPRASIRYNFTPDLNIYFTYSESYKSGLTGTANPVATAIAPQFQPVKPETLDSYEIGVKYGSPRFTLDVSGFYYNYKNKQEQIFLGVNSAVVNTPARLMGMDVDSSARLNDDFTLRAGLSWLPVAKYTNFPNALGYSDITSLLCGGVCNGSFNTVESSFNATGFRMLRAPNVTVSGTLSYEHAFSGGTVDASATLYYSSAIREDLTGFLTQKAYTTINAQAGYLIGTSGVRVGIFGRNLGNTAYLTAGLADSAAFITTYAPPREVGVSVGYKF